MLEVAYDYDGYLEFELTACTFDTHSLVCVSHKDIAGYVDGDDNVMK